jgi:predicted enzyme related to lactoylglutathione lyase
VAGSAVQSWHHDGKEAEMGERTSYLEGTPCWVDLMTTDPEGARAFYGALFGWEFDIDPNPETGNYTMCRLRGKTVAGMGGQPAAAGMPTGWTTYFAADDVDKIAERVAEHGGNVMMAPMDVMDAGRMAMASDRDGAMFGLWQAQQHIGSELVNEPGTLTWNELRTRDLAGATAFYTEALGLRWEDYGDGYKVAYVGSGVVAGAMEMSQEFPPGTPAHWHVYFAVDDTAASAARVTELGGTIQVPVTDSPQGPFAVANDPQGGVLSIIQVTNPNP